MCRLCPKDIVGKYCLLRNLFFKFRLLHAPYGLWGVAPLENVIVLIIYNTGIVYCDYSCLPI